jgi:UDPglucose 6-dehydrogenase
MNIGWIGLGKLGMPCAEAIAHKGHTVFGYDIESVNSQCVTVCDSIKSVAAHSDIVFVAVPTPHDAEYDGRAPTAHLAPKDFDYSIVKSVIDEANQHMNTTQLLVLVSTVLPGTVRRELAHLVTNTRFVYNPYLIAMGSVAWDMVNPEMVMIGTVDGNESGAAQQLTDFYKTIMENNPRYVVGTWDECECIKVFYNTWISTKIGLSNMILDVAERQGNINVDVVTQALADSTMRIMGPQYMRAGMGDGGACHPRDNIALRWMAQQLELGYDLFDSIMNAREQQAKNLAELLVNLAQQHNQPIVIHGKAYKPGVVYCDGSYSLLVGNYCKELGIDPIYVDTFTGDIYNPSDPCVFLMAHSAATTYKYTRLSEYAFDALYCAIPSGSTVVDPWRNYKTSNNTIKVIHYGNTRLGNRAH